MVLLAELDKDGRLRASTYDEEAETLTQLGLTFASELAAYIKKS